MIEYEEVFERIPVRHLGEVLDVALGGEASKERLASRLENVTGRALDHGVGGHGSPGPQ